MSRSIKDTLATAIQFHEAGRLAEAEMIYRQILTSHPDVPDAWHLLGVVAGQGGRLDEAVDYIQRAIRLVPDNAEYHGNLGRAFTEMGQSGQAVSEYKKAIELAPNQPALYNALGAVLRNDGKIDEAAAAFRQGLHLAPNNFAMHVNLGNALRDQGLLEEALAAYRQALKLQPDFSGARNNLANILLERGQLDEAIANYRQILKDRPLFTEAQFNLAGALRQKGEIEEAIIAYRQAVKLEPRRVDAHYLLASVLADKSYFQEAVASYQETVRLKPNHAEAYNGLGNALYEMERFDEAIDSLRRAISIKPRYSAAFNNLGNALRQKRQVDDAIAAYRQALYFQRHSTIALSNLANLLKDTGRFNDAIGCYREALSRTPNDAVLHSNLILALLIAGDANAILKESRRWNEKHALPLLPRDLAFKNDPSPERRLRVGYVSPHLHGKHGVAAFMLPLLNCHDHQQFEIICYSDVRRPDQITQRMMKCADVWRDTTTMTDQQLADQIRVDRIDILIDLAMHTADNRLLVFARKPAPVQITWLAYPGTTGVSAIDYRLTDPYLDPPGLPDDQYTERSIRLADTFWCYDPLATKLDIQMPPVLKNGFATFGCLNTFCKINVDVLRLWARVMSGVSGSKMMIIAAEGSHRQRVLDKLAKDGIEPDRVIFVTHRPRQDYLELYQQIDICLDPFPFNGGTTSLDSLWMGVPVITLIGNTVLGRAGLSLASNLRLTEFVAHTPDEYVEIAIQLAQDKEQLTILRSTLRQRLQESPLMDGPRFARNMESVFRQTWQAWCLTKT